MILFVIVKKKLCAFVRKVGISLLGRSINLDGRHKPNRPKWLRSPVSSVVSYVLPTNLKEKTFKEGFKVSLNVIFSSLFRPALTIVIQFPEPLII